MMNAKKLLPLLLCLLASGLQASDIMVSNVSLTGQNTSAGVNNVANFSKIQFDLRWYNSWRKAPGTGASNWDAAWVFAKFRVGNADIWLNGASSVGNVITVSSTAGLRPGMPVRITSGTGSFGTEFTRISYLISTTQFAINYTPSTALSGASIYCERYWEHAWLNSTGHSVPSAASLDLQKMDNSQAYNPTSNPIAGAFIYNFAPTATNNALSNFSSIQLQWNYGVQGIADNQAVEMKVFAIEMVYVPQGAFYAGDGSIANLTGQFRNGGSSNPLLISSEAALTLGGLANGNLSNNNASGMALADDFNSTTTQTLPANFPKGYNAFYCMKYEISQGQFKDFLNSCSRSEQAAQVPALAPGVTSLTNVYIMSNTAAITNRNFLRIYGTIFANDPVNVDFQGPSASIACNFLSQFNIDTYLRWACLRPMTELEYEKACRGPVSPVVGEFPFGTTIYSPNYVLYPTSDYEALYNFYDGSVYYPSSAHYGNFAGLSGPSRVGANAWQNFSGSRDFGGFSYYGILDLAGNLWESVVGVSGAGNRSYFATYGTNGTGYWDSRLYLGFSLRGGSWGDSQEKLQVSARQYAAYTTAFAGNAWNGGRGVRSLQ